MHHLLLVGIAALMAFGVIATKLYLLLRDHNKAARRRKRRRQQLGLQWAWDRFLRPIRFKQLSTRVKPDQGKPVQKRKPVNIARAWGGDIAGRRRRD